MKIQVLVLISLACLASLYILSAREGENLPVPVMSEDEEYLTDQYIEESQQDLILKTKLSHPMITLKSTVPAETIPFSGLYQGWVHLNNGKKWWMELNQMGSSTSLQIFVDGEDEPFMSLSSEGLIHQTSKESRTFYVKALNQHTLQLHLNLRVSALIGHLYRAEEHLGTLFLNQ